MQRLDRFSARAFDRGRPRWVEALWLLAQGLLVGSWLPGSGWRAALLRAFGARIGSRVVLKPHLKVKFPWRLTVGERSWIGEGVWIDNLAEVRIGAHAVLSQGAYLCTGSHRWDRESFDLITRPVEVGDHAWVGAMARLGPGTRVGEGAVVCLGATVTGELAGGRVHGAPGDGAPRRRCSGTAAG